MQQFFSRHTDFIWKNLQADYDNKKREICIFIGLNFLYNQYNSNFMSFLQIL